MKTPEFRFLTGGTTGDVEPIVNLTAEAVRRGIRVRVAGHSRFKQIIESKGAAFEDFGGEDPLKTMTGDMENLKLPKWLGIAKRLLYVRKHFSLGTATLDWLERFSTGDALIIYSSMRPAVRHSALAHGTPCVSASVSPGFPTAMFAPGFGPLFHHRRNLGGTYNRLCGLPLAWNFWLNDRRWLNPWRLKMGLPPLSFGEFVYQGDTPRINGFSELVVPRPSDWPHNHFVTGYWLDRDSTVGPVNGQEPTPVAVPKVRRRVYVYFGSNALVDRRFYTDCLLPALVRFDAEAVIGAGWSGHLDVNHGRIVAAGATSYWDLMAGADAVVHHAGAGTCAITLRSGVPQIPIPFFGEQRFWAARMERLGVAPEPVTFSQTTSETLSHQLLQIFETARFRDRARQVATALAEENGSARAVDLLVELAVRNRVGG